MRIFLFFITVVLFQGCTPYVQLDIDAISSPEACAKQCYVIESDDNQDLQHREFVSYTERALASCGFVKAASFNDADIQITLSYGISDPQVEHYTYSVPIYGQTGVSSTTTCGESYRRGDRVFYAEKTTAEPTYGVIGSETKIGTKINYLRFIHLSGVDRINHNPLWSIKVESIGESGDMREMFPILLGASKKYIGKNTGKQIRIVVDPTKVQIPAF